MRWLIIFLVGFLIFLGSTGCTSETDAQKTAMQSALSHMSDQLAVELEQIMVQLQELTREVRSAYESGEKRIQMADTEAYRMTAGGAFYRQYGRGKTALWVSGIVPVTDEIRRVAYLTESLDPVFERVVQNSPNVVQAYYNTRHSMTRIYPAFDVLTQFPEKMDIPSYNFYYLADTVHNPEKRQVWVNEPYVDPAGRGWMISAIAPVYLDGQLEGVTGLDVTVNTLTDRYLGADHANVMLVDQRGVVVAAQEKMMNLFALPPLVDHRYIDTIKHDTYRQEDFSLLRSKSRQVRTMAQILLEAGVRQTTLTINDATYQVVTHPLPELEWTLIGIIGPGF